MGKEISNRREEGGEFPEVPVFCYGKAILLETHIDQVIVEVGNK